MQVFYSVLLHTELLKENLASIALYMDQSGRASIRYRNTDGEILSWNWSNLICNVRVVESGVFRIKIKKHAKIQVLNCGLNKLSNKPNHRNKVIEIMT